MRAGEIFEKEKQKAKKIWIVVLCIAIVALFCLLIFLLQKKEAPSGFVKTISEAEYKETVQYPRREDYTDKNGKLDQDAYWAQMTQFSETNGWMSHHTIYNLEALNGFFSKCAEVFLSDAGDENLVISPLSLYFALDVLAETTSGESRQQILDLLGMKDMETLREQAPLVWDNNYRNNGLSYNLLANALWLDEDVPFHQETMERIAETCHASSYQVQMGSDAANKAYRQWLNERTKGLLSEQTDNMKLSSQNTVAITSTLYFFANWAEKFDESDTKQGMFYGAKKKASCDFMNQTLDYGRYYWGEKFTAVSQQLNDEHWFVYVLPDEGYDVETLLSDPEYLEFAGRYSEWKNKMSTKVNLSVPKFDVSSELSLSEGLQDMGVTDVFDADRADFSEMTTSTVAITELKQNARLMIDETGCTAGAITEVRFGGGGPQDEVEFILNRPFLFMVTNADALPLFMGVVNQP